MAFAQPPIRARPIMHRAPPPPALIWRNAAARAVSPPAPRAPARA
ncbi:hypothetical protein L506_1861 [Bordetella bronchiseptica GA96-01]|nr:hypothetical protein L572_1887 [Bordetella bronchiseptica 345]KDC33305.1 hypothetical protein L506_1861 [Bordetella bronchiseptica GA96-01]